LGVGSWELGVGSWELGVGLEVEENDEEFTTKIIQITSITDIYSQHYSLKVNLKRIGFDFILIIF
jgi:hypothetical protein